MLMNKEVCQKLDFKAPSVWLATWFGCGLMKKAPGTWGTLGGLPFGIAVLYFGSWQILLAASVFVFLMGLWAAREFEKMTGEHDAGAVVIDEVAGVWIALLPVAGLSFIQIGLAFLLFRFFDILKPWPVSWADKKLPGAMGVMLDDVFAGIYAALVIGGLRYYAGLGW